MNREIVNDLTYAFREQAPESCLMWCIDGTKQPCVSHCQAKVDAGEIEAWTWERFDNDTQKRLARDGDYPTTLAILARDIVVLDFDTEAIFETVAPLFPEDFDEYNTVNERTRKGRHFFYKRPTVFDVEGIVDKANAFKEAGFPAMDIKTACGTGSRGVIVIAPSPNKEWITSPMECELREPSADLIAWILKNYERVGGRKTKPLSRAISDATHVASATPATPAALPEGLREMLDGLAPSRADNYGDWIRVGMILYNENVSLDIWRDWSRRSTKFQEGSCEKAWASFRKSCLTIASLWAMVKTDNLGVFRSLHGKRKDIEKALLDGAAGSHEPLATVFFNNNPDEYLYEEDSHWWFCHDVTWANCNSDKGPSTLIGKVTKCLRTEVADLRAYYIDRIRILANEDNSDDKVKEIEEKNKLMAKLSTKIGTAGFVAGVIVFLRGLYSKRTHEIIKDIAEYDANVSNVTTLMNHRRDLFAFTDIVYDFGAKIVRPIARNDFISMTCGYKYPQGSNSEVRDKIKSLMRTIWERKPDANTKSDEDLTDGIPTYWLDTVASCLNGNRTQQAFYIHTGSGGNGKGILQTLLRAVFGNYFAPLNAAIVTQAIAANGHTADIADLAGRRFVVVNEPEGDVKLNEGIIKMFTGGDKITASRKGKDPFQFLPQFGLFMYCNNLPAMKSLTEGGVRRIRVIDYPFKFVNDPKADFERQSNPAIIAEVQSVEWRNEFILMLIDHYSKIHEKSIDALITPPKVLEACEAYIKDNNRIWSWWTENYVQKQDGFIVAAHALADYNTENPGAKMDMKGFKDALSFNRITVVQCRAGIDRGKRGIVGWSLKPQNESALSEDC